MSQNCDFDSHIASVAKKCSRLRRRDRYMAIYIWKIVEENVPNFSPPIQGHISAHRGRLCNSGVVPTGHLGTLCHNSFRSKAATTFNCLPKHIRNLVNCANQGRKSMFKHGGDNIWEKYTSSFAPRLFRGVWGHAPPRNFF